MGGAQQLAVPTRDASSLQKQVVNKVGDWLKDRAVAKALCSVSRKQKQATRVFYFTNARILHIDYNIRSGGISAARILTRRRANWR